MLSGFCWFDKFLLIELVHDDIFKVLLTILLLHFFGWFDKLLLTGVVLDDVSDTLLTILSLFFFKILKFVSELLRTLSSNIEDWSMFVEIAKNKHKFLNN